MSLCGEHHPTKDGLICTRPFHPFGMHSHDPSSTYWEGSPVPSASSRKDNQRLIEQIVKSAQGNVGFQPTLDQGEDIENEAINYLEDRGYIVHAPGHCPEISIRPNTRQIDDRPDAKILDFPAKARKSDPQTSQDAAQLVTARATSARIKLLEAHAANDSERGLTDEEAAILAGVDLLSEYATRCSELRNLGALEDLEISRLSSSGMLRQARRITEVGREIMRARQA